MGRRFVFVEELQDIISKGRTEIELPEGTRFSPAAKDMIQEKNIRVLFTGNPVPDDNGGGASVGDEHNVVTQNSVRMDTFIAVVSAGKTVTDTVGNVAARSPYFLLFNSQGELVEVLENPYRNAGGGAGPLVAELMASRNVKTVIAGNFGVNIAASLKEKGVRFLVFSGSVGEAVQSSLVGNGS